MSDEFGVASARFRPEPSEVEQKIIRALPEIARAIEEWLFGGASDADTAAVILALSPPGAMQAARHLRVAQIIWDDGPDESDKAQADLHMSAAVLLAKAIVPWGETVVTDADAHRVINEAPASLKTGGRDV